MAKFTVDRAIGLDWHGNALNGPPGTVHRIPDALYDSFIAEFVTGKDGIAPNYSMPNLVWVEDDEVGAAGGEHPNLATHDALGLATDAELTTHANAADPHTGYALDADLTNHEGAADPHAGYVKENDASWVDLTDLGQTTLHSHPGGGGAPTDADYLVGTAHAGLSAEIVVGTSPGGELGGTWAAPTVDDTHSGSTHAGVIATHEGAADPHTGYQRESEKAAASGYASLDGTTKVPIAQIATGTTSTTVALGDAAAALDATHAAASDPHTGYQKESEKGAANGYASLGAGGLVPIAQLASGTPNGLKFVRDDGTLVTPGGGDDARFTFAHLASQHSNSTTTPTKVTGLDLTLGAGTWRFDYRLIVRAATAGVAPQFNLNFTGTGAPTWWYEYADLSATLLAAIGQASHNVTTQTLGFGMRQSENVEATTAAGNMGPSGGLQSTATDTMIVIQGIVVVSVSGNIELWHGSETATATTVEVGSNLIATKMG